MVKQFLAPRPRSAAKDEPLEVVVTHLFPVKQLGVIAVGKVRTGVLHTGDAVEVVRPDGQTMRVRVRSLEFISGPDLPRDSVNFRLEARADAFLAVGAVVRRVPEN